MTAATPEMRNFARRLIAYEFRGKSAATKLAPGFLVCDRLRPHLATLMGLGGFRALLARAQILAGGEIPWLRHLQIKTDGTFAGVEELGRKVDLEELTEGRVVLIAHLLGLLVVFIGEKLTLGLVHEVWPGLSPGNLNFNNGGKNEKAK